MTRLVLSFLLTTFLHASGSWCGIQVQLMNKDMLESCGLQGDWGTIVVAVDQASPAKHALQKDDVVLEVNQRRIHGPTTLPTIQVKNSDSLVQLKVWRNNEELSTSFTLPKAQAGRKNLDDNILGNVEFEVTAKGVKVVAVHRQGMLQVDDKILEINNQKIQRVEDIPHALKADTQSLSIAMERDGAKVVQSLAINGDGSFFSSQTIITTN